MIFPKNGERSFRTISALHDLSGYIDGVVNGR
jgi:hypothetical protein